jgi:hypothetical protein
MKDLLLPLLLVGAAVVGVWFYLKNNNVVAGRPFVNAPATVEATAEKKPAPPPRRHQPVETASAAAPTPLPEPPPPAPKAAPVAVRTATAEAIQPGMSANQITQMFGEPDLRTTTVDRGTLHQIYVFRRKPGNRGPDVVFVHLKNGEVEDAASKN